jgi:amino acid adenylation domain-containing protein
VSDPAPLDELLASLAARGIELWCEGDRLRFHAPKGALDAEQRALLSGRRSEIIAALRAADAARSIEVPLSAPQFMMWFQHVKAPSSAVCTVGFALQASGPLNVGALRHAVQALVDRHAAMRTTYHVRDGALLQRIAGAARATLEEQSCAASDAPSTDGFTTADGLASQIESQIARPFDLTTGPLFRFVLFTESAVRHTLLVTFHHIAADAWSGQIMISELLALYAEAADNRPPQLPRPAAEYADFVRWQAALVDGEQGEQQWSHWRTVLAAPRQRSVLPTALVRPAVARFAGASLRTDLSSGLARRVQVLAARLGTTPFVVLLGAFQLLMARLCDVRDVTTGTPALGRPAAEYRSVVGNFINVLPVRSRLDDAATLSEFLGQLHATVVAALEAQDYPLSRIVQRLHLSGEETGQALFNTTFTLLKPDGAGAAPGHTIAGTTFALQPLVFQAGLLDLSVDIVASGTGMHFILKYSLDVLTARAAADLAQQYAVMITSIVDGPEQALAQLLGASNTAASDDARASALLRALAKRDISLALDGERLRVNAPKGALDEALRQSIAELRPAIIERLRTDGAQSAAQDFWRLELEGLPSVLALPTDRPRTDRGLSSTTSAARVWQVPKSLLDRLRAVGDARDANVYTTLMAAWQVLLHRYCGQNDIVVVTATATTTAATASRAATSPVQFARPARAIPVRGRLEGNPPFDRFLDQLHRTVLAAVGHSTPPLPRCQAAFDLHAAEDAASAGPHAPYEGVELALDIRALAEDEQQDAVQFRYRFVAALFDSDTVERLHENFCTLLDAIAADPTVAVDDLPLLGPTERARRLCHSGADAHAPHDRSRCVHHLLEESARLQPGRIAVSGAGGELSYDALDAQANRLANCLLRGGWPRGATVAVCLERTVNLPVALAAVLKAGCAYVPLDPAHPRERLRQILVDARAVCLITQTGLEQVADATGAHVIRLDTDAGAIDACASASPGIAVQPNDLAYVIYTSGSTGRPKGVEVEHRNVVSFLDAMARRPGLAESDVLLALTTVAFDIAGLEIWLPLAVGARIVLATRADAVDGARLAALLEAHAVSVMQATPASWRLLLESGWAGRASLRALCGGEALPPALAQRLLGVVGELWNLYGPTETTIWSTAARVDATSAAHESGLIAIGRPIANTTVRIEDAAGREVPTGVAGELLIGGEGVARGYRDRPDLTARAFVLRDVDGATSRLYRTGDLARFRGDGQLEFLGRRDHQIKLRGHRIEPGEIESLLMTHPGVSGSIVVAFAAPPDDERLVAYVTLATGTTLDAGATLDAGLRASLRARLPEYMVPSHIVVLPAFPLTPNGKVDRAALPAPSVHRDVGADVTPHIPAVLMTSAQQRVAVLWKEVLSVGRVGLNDNFFDLGGHSLLLVKIHAGLKREFGCDMPLVDLFQHTTVAQQARALESSSHA